MYEQKKLPIALHISKKIKRIVTSPIINASNVLYYYGPVLSPAPCYIFTEPSVILPAEAVYVSMSHEYMQ